MNLMPPKRLVIYVYYFFFGSIVLWNLISIYRSDPDGNHDGIMLAPAIAVRDGLLPNRDFFSLYGPITPFLQGTWLKVTGGALLQLRYFSLAVILLTAVLTFHLTSKFLTKKLAIAICLAWLSTGPSGLPWSSLILNFFYLVIIWLYYSSSIRNEEAAKKGIYFCIGILCAMTFFVRVQMLITFVLIFALIFFTERNKWKFSLYFATGGIVAFITSGIFLVKSGALIPFVEQGIIWAASFYGSPRIDRSYILNLFWFPLIAIMTFAFIRLRVYKRSERPDSDISWRLMAVFSTLLFSILSFADRSMFQSLFSVKALLLTASWNFSHWLGFCAVSIGILLLLIVMKELTRSNAVQIKNLLRDNAALLIATSSLTQLYPFYDLWHIWFITPILVVGLSSNTIFRNFVAENFSRFFSLLIIFISVSSLFTLISHKGESYDFKAPILRGMKSEVPNAEALDDSLIRLAKYGSTGHIKFICPIGLYAVANGKYMANDLNYVNWGNFYDSRFREIEQVFICESSQAIVDEYLAKGWRIVFMEPFVKDDYDQKVYTINALLERK